MGKDRESVHPIAGTEDVQIVYRRSSARPVEYAILPPGSRRERLGNTDAALSAFINAATSDADPDIPPVRADIGRHALERLAPAAA